MSSMIDFKNHGKVQVAIFKQAFKKRRGNIIRLNLQRQFHGKLM